MMPEDEPPMLECVQYSTGEEGRAITNSSSKSELWLCQSRDSAQLWMCLVVKVKPDAVKNNIAQKRGMQDPRMKISCMWSSRKWQE